jgi:uncharacterized coiled-coil DUF342 family protein
MEKSLVLDQSLAEKLGESFDLSGTLKKQQDEVQKTLRELLSIDPSKINESFTFDDASIQALVDRFRALGTQIKALDYNTELGELTTKIKGLSKSEEELALAAFKAKGYSDEQAAALAKLTTEFSHAEKLKEYNTEVSELTTRIEGLGKSEEELALAAFKAKGYSDEQAAALAKLTTSSPCGEAQRVQHGGL